MRATYRILFIAQMKRRWLKSEKNTNLRYTYLVATGTRVQSYPWRTLATAALIPSPPLAATVAAAATAAAAAVADALPLPLMPLLLLLLLLFPPAGEIDAPLLSGLTSFIFIPLRRARILRGPFEGALRSHTISLADLSRATRGNDASHFVLAAASHDRSTCHRRDTVAAFVIALSSRRVASVSPRDSRSTISFASCCCRDLCSILPSSDVSISVTFAINFVRD